MPSRPRPVSDGTMPLRWLLFGLLTAGLLVTGVDLMLLDHHEDVWQSIPLILIGTALLVILWHAVSRDATSLRALQVVMVLFVVAAGTGIVLHYRGNLEFQIEMDPTQSGWELFNKVIRAKAPPAAAPSVMAQLGLIGLIYTFRHPALQRPVEVSHATLKGD
jgi:hypothetical protein